MNPQLYRAASSGDLSFFEKLENSETLAGVTIEKSTVLHVAVQCNQLQFAQKIVELRQSLLYETNSKGNTSLHVAARIGYSSVVKLLIDNAKDQRDAETSGQQQLLSMVNQDGDTALHVAVQYGNFEVVKELIKEKDPTELAMKVNNAGESALFLAVDREHYKMANYILNNAPDCSYAGRHGMNALHAVVLQTTSNCKWLDPACSLNISALSILHHV